MCVQGEGERRRLVEEGEEGKTGDQPVIVGQTAV